MKCKYSNKCKYYREDGFTCNSYDAENGYCGAYREFEKVKLVSGAKNEH